MYTIQGVLFKLELGARLAYTTAIRIFGKSDHALVTLLVSIPVAERILEFLAGGEASIQVQVDSYTVEIVRKSDIVSLSVNSSVPVKEAEFSVAEFKQLVERIL